MSITANSADYSRIFDPILSGIGLLVVWWVTATVLVTAFPSPVTVADAAITLAATESYYQSILTSAYRVYVPFIVAACIGIPLGLLAGWYKPAADLIMPGIELLRPIPPIAWVPAVILLFPGTEIGVMYITFLGALFPILLNAYEGSHHLDREYTKAAHSLGAGVLIRFRHVILPGAAPSLITGLYVGMGLAWINLVAAEMIAGGSGLGYFIWASYTGGSYPNIIVGMLTIAALGALSTTAVKRISIRVAPWHDLDQPQ